MFLSGVVRVTKTYHDKQTQKRNETTRHDTVRAFQVWPRTDHFFSFQFSASTVFFFLRFYVGENGQTTLTRDNANQAKLSSRRLNNASLL